MNRGEIASTSSSYSTSKHKHHKSSNKKSKKSKKMKKRSHRRSSSDDSSGSGSSSEEDEQTLMQRRAEQLRKKKEDQKREKELIKAVETAEEKRARRLAKKEAKERKKRSQMGWDDEYMGYTNTDNPFGDANLLQTFVWKKKMEKEGKQDVSKDELEKINKLKMEESKRELEKVKKRRMERERELVERDREREMLQREKESEYYQEWEKQEDKFHLNQARLRSQIRIQDGRAKPIDLLAKYISAEDDDFAVEMHEPYTYLNGLTMKDLEDLLEDIAVYTEIDTEGRNVDYWQDMTCVVRDELHKLRKLDTTGAGLGYVGDRRGGINPAVSSEVINIFKGKSHSQLIAMETQIQGKIRNVHEGVDVGYWESLLQQLKAYMARARLKDKHQQVLKKKLLLLKQEQGMDDDDDDDGPVFPIIPGPSSSGDGGGGSGVGESESSAGERRGEGAGERGEEGKEGKEGEEGNEEGKVVEEYVSGEYSPQLLPPDQVEATTVIEDESVDQQRLEAARRQVAGYNMPVTQSEDVFEREARKGVNSDEALFSVEHKLDDQQYLWQDKYKPRKPRFFNRVHTGFEWNKYNQTHYDLDNPPPKVVQGYKFNIFYPDLIDKNNTPQYTLTPEGDNKDFAVLRFRAGPPYEDIAFKIVNKEWEIGHRRGFRCQFYNNIFQLWFHFRRYRYRR